MTGQRDGGSSIVFAICGAGAICVSHVSPSSGLLVHVSIFGRALGLDKPVHFVSLKKRLGGSFRSYFFGALALAELQRLRLARC